MVHLEKEEEICQFVHEAASESTKVISIVRDEAKEKVEDWLTVWLYEMLTNKV